MSDSSSTGGSGVVELGPLYITDYELPEGEPTPLAPVGPEKHVAEETTEWLAVCSYPDSCMVGDKVVPFDSCALLDQQVLASPDVKARGNCVYRQGDMFKGVLGDAGAHVVSETSLGDGHVLILEGHNKVKVNNIPVACHDGPCMINTNAMGMGGTPGRLLTEISIPGTSSVPTGPSSSARLEQLKGLQEKLGRGQFDLDKLDEYVQFGELNDIIDGIQGTEGTWTDYLAQGTRGVLKFGTGIGEGAYELVKLGGKLIQRSPLQNFVDGAVLAENMRLGNVTAGSIGSQALETGKAIIVPPEAQEAWQKGATTEAAVHTVLNVGTLVGGLAKSAGGLFRRTPKVEPIPPKVPEPPPPAAMPEPTPPPRVPEQPSSSQGVKVKQEAPANKANGKSDGPCPTCIPLQVGPPVYVLTGAKVLNGASDLDFVLEAPLPLVWQRSYLSSNAHVGWLGQGWSLPIDFRLEVQEERIDFVDMYGRRTHFPTLAVGEHFFSKYEHSTLQRNQRNQYEVVEPDGLRLIFGLGPLDRARHEVEEDVHGNLPPQAQTLYLLGMIDPNHNHLRLHYSDDGLPRHIDTSSGRRVGFIFDRTRVGPRLTHVVELLGEPDGRGHYSREQQQWLVEYRYSAEGDLIEVRDGDGQLGRTFAWRNHMMVEHTEPGGLVARYQWDQFDPKGRVLRSSTAQGQSWTFDYDEVAGCTRVTDASGREERFLYDKDKKLIGLVDAAGGKTHYERDAYGNLIALIDPAGRVTRRQYDDRGNLLGITQPDGARYQLRWHERWRKPVAVSDPLGRTTHYRYDERGNLIAVTEPNGAVTEYQLDGRGLPTTILDARGGRKHLEHDAQGRLLAYTDCSGNRTQYSYDAQGRLASVTDALGHNTQYGYARINRRDRLNSIRHADGAIERFAYDPLGRLIAHHDPLGRVTRYQLDTEGRPLQRIDALGHSLRYEYDVHGRLVRLHNENNAIYRFAWDALDRLVAEQGFDGRRIDYRYDATGQLLESVDGVPASSAHLGRSTGALLRTRYQRDAMGRLLDKFSYKPGTDGKPQLAHSRYHYDAAGQLVRARNRQARVELFYNQAGQLAREVLYSRGGQRSELSHAYDLLGNRETTTLPDGRQLNTLTYGSGHVHQINLDFEVICDFERDALHRETGRTQGALYTHSELDPLGRLLRSQASLQRQATNPQVGPGLDTSESSQGQRIARRYQYDLAGQLLGIDDRRNGSTRYGYDALGRLLSAQAPQVSEVFAFDPAHNLMQPEEAQRQETRLKQTTWSEEEWSAYVQANLANPDFNPLLTPAEAQADPSTWGENKPNRLRVWEEHRYAYDAWGNCIEKKSGPHTERQFQWDAEHQLSRVSVTRRQERFTHTEHWGYDYDPFGRRIAKYRLDPHNEKRSRPWLDDETTHYGWDGNRLLLERQGDKQQLYIYQPRSFVPLAMVRSEGAQTKTQGLPPEYQTLKEQYPEQWDSTLDKLPRKVAATIRQFEHPKNLNKSPVEILYYHTDHLGTPRELTDRDGHIVWSATYKAWGNAAKIERSGRLITDARGNVQVQRREEQTEPVEQNLRFQGQYYDQETELHCNRFRYYDPDCGRFLSQDPIGLLGGLNNYQYAPNPVVWIDPLGLCKCPGDSTAGGIKIESGAVPDSNEIRAGQGLSDIGYDVTHQATASAKGVQGQRTADLYVNGIGSVDVYTPQNISPNSIVRAIEKKANQAGGVLVQADLSSVDMSSVAARMWGKTNAQNIRTIFFQKPDGSIVRFDRPSGGG
ncbi:MULTISPECIES: RHS repeat-associated core domain-containing protein [unclassified Pseudomonas]|uniref:RHS repeat-associated core domain-containing protein n=1 Tax=unclassified Pseudomonas TaxID=196821 RepID=UPI00244C5289|nr:MULTISPECIES: RHS repeat-associated core domain-containing protein [unclassified Pseudomonas]MDH0893369.1 DUF6531 domain-containing protein [Pseudomonas sp. GD03875]MDH1067391.1 DUF6531 domain-containing protein [Pseudomonas sp. GD03985]